MEFTEDRTNSMVSQILNVIPGYKLKASSVAEAIANNIYFSDNNIIHHASFLRQKKLMDEIKEQMDKDPKPVLDRLKVTGHN